MESGFLITEKGAEPLSPFMDHLILNIKV